MIDRRLAIIGVGAFGTSFARADLYDDYINSTSKLPFVAFLARKGVPGHAFVGVGVDLRSDLRVYERFFGLYPDNQGKLSSLKLVFGKTSGRLDYKWEDSTWDTMLVKRVAEEEKSAVLKQFQKWSASTPEYSLLGNGGMNCNQLAGDVAKSIKLSVPGGGATMLPWNYIDALKQANPQ